MRHSYLRCLTSNSDTIPVYYALTWPYSECSTPYSRVSNSNCSSPCSRVSFSDCHSLYSWLSYPEWPGLTLYSRVSYSECPTPYSRVSYSECPTPYICALRSPTPYKSPTPVGASWYIYIFFLFIILRRYKFLIYKFTNSTMNTNSYTN